MKRWFPSRAAALLALGFLLLAPHLLSQPATDVAAPARPAPSGEVERGRYLVHHVAMCVQCHSPRDRYGELEQNRLLRGASALER